MPNSEQIPSGSAITEAMISLYMAQVANSTRSSAIAALRAIETGTTAPSTAQRGNPVYSPLISAYDQSVGAFGEGGRIISPTSENDVTIAGPAGTGKWISLSSLLGLVTIAAIAVTNLVTQNLTATNATITNATTTREYVTNFESPTVPKILTVAFTNATHTPVAIAFPDATGTRLILAAWIEQPTSTSGGAVSYVAGTSTNSFTTSTSPFIAMTLVRAATGPELTTVTSTMNSTSTFNPLNPQYYPWSAPDTIVVKSNATTVHSGTLNLLYR
jgi:hypothetical protein